MISQIIFSLLGLRPLLAYTVEGDKAEVNSGFRYLYGAKLVSTTEKINTFLSETPSRLLNIQDKGKMLYIVIMKYQEPTTGFYKTDVYYFTFNKNVMLTLKNSLGEKFQIMSGAEIVDALIQLTRQENMLQFNETDRVIINRAKFLKLEDKDLVPVDAFAKMMKDVNMDEFTVYAGIRFDGGNVDYERLLSTKFTGVLWICLDFETALIDIRRKMTRSGNAGPVFKALEREEKEGIYKKIVLSTTFITKDKKPEEYIVNMFGSIGFTPLKMNTYKDLFLRSTPLLYRDTDFSYLIDTETAGKFMITSYEKTEIPARVDIYGSNRRGSYVAYNIFEENPAPHAVVFAKTGSGKSFGLQNLITQMLGLDVKALWYGDRQLRVNENLRVRYIDKGFSAEGMFLLMKERGLDSAVFSSELEKLSFNVCEVDDELDLEFSLHVVNACLAALDYEELKGFERRFYLQALRYYMTRKHETHHANAFLSVIKNYRSLEKVYQEIRSLGFSDRDTIMDIVNKYPNYSFLIQPTLGDIVKYLTNESGKTSYTQDERDAITRAITALTALLEFKEISQPAQVDIKNSNLIYLDVEILSKSTFFVPLTLGILRKLLKTDYYFKPPGMVAYYIIDEAHNFFVGSKNKVSVETSSKKSHFEEALIVLIKEARKYGVSVWLSTQDFQDIPLTVINNAHTRMLIAPVEDADKKAFMINLEDHLGTKISEDDIGYVYSLQPARTFSVWYSKGAFSLILPVDEAKLQLFDSRLMEFQTPDGKYIKKTPARMRLGE
ncbi:MAG TPA: ATP-binding protein [Thermodesulfobium narugense]|nr:ATP-binding protein [Thermodesulfobium narugense]